MLLSLDPELEGTITKKNMKEKPNFKSKIVIMCSPVWRMRLPRNQSQSESVSISVFSPLSPRMDHLLWEAAQPRLKDKKIKQIEFLQSIWDYHLLKGNSLMKNFKINVLKKKWKKKRKVTHMIRWGISATRWKL